MMEKLKNNKYLFWLVPVILALPYIIKLVMQLIANNANKDLEKAIEKNKELKDKQEQKEKEAQDEYNKAKDIEEKINNIKAKDGWHKSKIKKD